MILSPTQLLFSPEEKQPWTKLINSDVFLYENSQAVYRSTDVMFNAGGAKYHTALPQVNTSPLLIIINNKC